MRYVLARVYNPIYDFFFFRYLTENGIDVGEDSPLEQLEDIALGFQNAVERSRGGRQSRVLSSNLRLEMSLPKRLLHDYASSWKREPSARPSTIYYLEGILGEGRPDSRALESLETQLPLGRGRLLFSSKEAAIDFASFYRTYLVNPLKRNIDRHDSRKLLRFFDIDEIKGLPSLQSEGEVGLDRAIRKMADDVLARIAKMTPGAILRDIDIVIDEHWQSANQSKVGKHAERYQSHQHRSESVELFCTHNTEEGSDTATLRPTRGFLIWVTHERAPQYASAKFPQYRVYTE